MSTAVLISIASLAFITAGALLTLTWPSGRKVAYHDYLITKVEAPTSPLPLQRVRLLTPRLVLLAAAKADVYWGGTRCTSITFDFEKLGDRRIAEAQWATASDSSNYLDCHVTFNTDPTRIRTTFWHYCAAVVHEYGHLAGHGHSTDRTSVMFPSLSDANVPKTCKRLVYP
jgi:Matrixin